MLYFGRIEGKDWKGGCLFGLRYLVGLEEMIVIVISLYWIEMIDGIFVVGSMAYFVGRG